MRETQILALVAFLSDLANAANQKGWCFDRNGLASDYSEITGTQSWPKAYKFTLQTLDTCWLEATQSSYITWRINE